MPNKSSDSTDSTSAAFGACCTSGGRTESLWQGVLRVGRQLLRHKDIIKQDLQSALINTSAWEDIAKHRDTWWQSVKSGVSKAEANARVQATWKRAVRKECAASVLNSMTQLRHLQQKLPHQDRATQSYKILPKSPALTIASSRRGCLLFGGGLPSRKNRVSMSPSQKNTFFTLAWRPG